MMSAEPCWWQRCFIPATRYRAKAAFAGLQKHTAVYSTLKRIALAEQRSLDIWSVSFTASAPSARSFRAEHCLPALCVLYRISPHVSS